MERMPMIFVTLFLQANQQVPLLFGLHWIVMVMGLLMEMRSQMAQTQKKYVVIYLQVLVVH